MSFSCRIRQCFGLCYPCFLQQTISHMRKRFTEWFHCVGRINIVRVNIGVLTGWKKIKQRRISFVLVYLRTLWKISTAISIKHRILATLNKKKKKIPTAFKYYCIVSIILYLLRNMQASQLSADIICTKCPNPFYLHIYSRQMHLILYIFIHVMCLWSTSRNWFVMQGTVAIILISWNVIFIWETDYWTRAIKRFALFDLLKSLYSDTKDGFSYSENVKNIFYQCVT